MTSFRTIVGPCRYLARDEERELVRAWQEDRDQEAWLALFRGIFPLMLQKVNLFCRRHGRLDVEEFEAAASVGVLRAIDRFDRARGNRLSTYAIHAAWDHMHKALCERVIRLPQNYLMQQNNLAEIGRSLSTEQLPDFVDEMLGAGDDEQRLDQAEQHAAVAAAIERHLGQREREIVMAYYLEGKTLLEIGKSLGGLSRERVRQIKEEALARLRRILEPSQAA